MIYEIVNPSDPYTLVAENRGVAAVVYLLLGNGKYGLKPENKDGGDFPLFLFATVADIEKWFKGRFGATIEEFMDAHMKEVADCFATVLIGDRTMHDELASCVPASKSADFEAKWQDRHRSSMNDIGGRAKAWERDLRARILKKKETP